MPVSVHAVLLQAQQAIVRAAADDSAASNEPQQHQAALPRRSALAAALAAAVAPWLASGPALAVSVCMLLATVACMLPDGLWLKVVVGTC